MVTGNVDPSSLWSSIVQESSLSHRCSLVASCSRALAHYCILHSFCSCISSHLLPIAGAWKSPWNESSWSVGFSDLVCFLGDIGLATGNPWVPFVDPVQAPSCGNSILTVICLLVHLGGLLWNSLCWRSHISLILGIPSEVVDWHFKCNDKIILWIKHNRANYRKTVLYHNGYIALVQIWQESHCCHQIAQTAWATPITMLSWAVMRPPDSCPSTFLLIQCCMETYY